MSLQDATAAMPVPSIRPRPRLATRLARMVRREPVGFAGLVLLAIIGFVAVFREALAPHDPTAFVGLPFQSPSSEFPFGTDYAGRDVLSRVIYGAWTSLRVGVLSVLLGGTAGAAIGVLGGYLGGWVDAVIQRFVDALMGFPALLLALSLVAALGFSVTNVIIAIAVAEAPRTARILRLETLSLKERHFVDAARALGARDMRILMVHVAPHCISPYIVLASISLAGAIIAEASLSFLGLGVPAPNASWGAMLSGPTLTNLEQAPHLVIFPGLFLALTVLAVNAVGDAVRNLLDPKLRGR